MPKSEKKKGNPGLQKLGNPLFKNKYHSDHCLLIPNSDDPIPFSDKITSNNVANCEDRSTDLLEITSLSNFESSSTLLCENISSLSSLNQILNEDTPNCSLDYTEIEKELCGKDFVNFSKLGKRPKSEKKKGNPLLQKLGNPHFRKQVLSNHSSLTSFS